MVEIVLQRDGIKALLKSDEMLQMCESLAEARKSSDEHVKSFIGFDRAHAIIYPDIEDNHD